MYKITSDRGSALLKRRLARLENSESARKSTVFNKHKIASDIAKRFPALAPRLSAKRKNYQKEDYRMSMFDAVSFAITFFESNRPNP